LSETRKAPHSVFFSSLLLPVKQYRKITKMAVQSAAVLLAVRNARCGPCTGYPNALVVVFLSVSEHITFVSRPVRVSLSHYRWAIVTALHTVGVEV